MTTCFTSDGLKCKFNAYGSAKEVNIRDAQLFCPHFAVTALQQNPGLVKNLDLAQHPVCTVLNQHNRPVQRQLLGENEDKVIPLNAENLAAIGGGNKGSGGVVVNITNKTDSQVKVQNTSYDDGLEKWVLDVVVDGAARNRGGFGSNLRTALGGQM